jgi:hypothetical protein
LLPELSERCRLCIHPHRLRTHVRYPQGGRPCRCCRRRRNV